MTLSKWMAAVVVGGVVWATAAVGAEPVSTLLEKGLYYEQTAGDVEAAMQVFEKLVADSQANRRQVATARYHLGLCQLKRQQPDAAAQSFRTVVAQYSDQKDIVEQANKQLAGNGGGGNDQAQKRAIGKAVPTFPESMDLSTPEGAAVAWNRASGKMDATALAGLSWLPLDPGEMDRVWQSAEKRDIDIYNKAQLNGVIIEAWTYKDDFAGVITYLTFPAGVGRSPYSLRYFGQSQDQWKNMGEDRLANVGEARQTFQRKMARIREGFHKAIGAGNGSSSAKDQVSADADRQKAIEQVFADPEPIVTIAKEIFEAIRTADYDRWINGEGWGSFPMVQYYQTYQWYDALVPWICKTFKADPIQNVTLGEVIKNEDGLPAIPYKLTLASGKVMDGVLPFNYKDGKWYARWGLDWHLGERMRLTEAKKAAPPAGGPVQVQVKQVDKPVAAFAAGDLSSPESAAANFCRASGNMDARALAAVSLAPVDPVDMQRAFDRNRADMEVYNKAQLTATIVQALTYRDGVAMVITKLNFPAGVGRHPFSGRMFGLFGGQWKNMGEDRYPSPEAARAAFEKVKDMVWDDYAQTVQGQNKGGGGGTVGIPPLAANLKDIERRVVDRAISDFPDKMDLSTPEAAFASWEKAWARMDAQAVVEASRPNGSTVRELQARFDKARQKDPTGEVRKDTLKATLEGRIVEVLIYRNDMAAVIAKVPRGSGGSYYSSRGFGKMGGQWKNLGEEAASSVEEAEQTFARKKDNLWKFYQGAQAAGSMQQQAEQNPELIEGKGQPLTVASAGAATQPTADSRTTR